MGQDYGRDDEDERRRLQEYIFSLEEGREKALEISLEHEKLRQAQESLVSHAPVGFLSIDRNGTILKTNQRLLDILGSPSDEAARSINVLTFPPLVNAGLSDLFRRCMGDARIINVEHSYTSEWGRELYLRDSLVPVWDLRGQVCGCYALIEDITERKQAEQERLANLRFFESMDRINRAIQGTNDLEQMMSDVLDVVLSIFDCDRAFLMYPCDPHAASWTSPMERTRPEYPGVLALGLEMPVDAEVAATLRILLAADGPVKFGPGTPYPLPEHVSERFGFKCFMSMALRPRVGSSWQFGIHQCSYARVWTQEEERLLQEIGRRLEDGLSALLVHRNLRDNMGKLEEAQRIGHIGYWDRDIAGNQVALADEACRIFGISAQESVFNLEQWHERWLTLLHPEDRQRANQAYVEALASGPPYNVEYRIVRPDGEVRHIHSEANVTWDESGHAIRILGMMQDITERKQAEKALQESEARYRQLADVTFEAIAFHDHGVILQANDQFFEMFGYEPEGLIGNQTIDKLLTPESAAMARERIESDSTDLYEAVGVRKDGKEFPIEVRATYRRSGDRQIRAVAIRDISENKDMEKRLLEAQKMQAVGTLAGGIAHDFNNLLHVIHGYADMGLFHIGRNQPGYTELLEIKKAAKRAAELTQGLLTFSRRVEGQRQPLDVNLELKQISKMLERTIPKMIAIELDLASDLLAVQADPGQLQQSVMNLAVNARDAMSDGGRLVIQTANVMLDEEFCRLHPGIETGKYVMLGVSDTGCGIDKETQTRIFDPFFTTKEVGKGTGLGLSIVFGIVKSHGGTITCYSEPGQGTAFKIYLPAIKQSQRNEEKVESQRVVGGTENILLADDEDTVRRLGKSILKMFGYSVLTASNGREALQVFQEHREDISLVILDLIMPEMGGRECLREILRIDPAAKVLIASGYGADGHIDGALGEGAKTSISKPYEARQLLEAVRRVLDA